MRFCWACSLLLQLPITYMQHGQYPVCIQLLRRSISPNAYLCLQISTVIGAALPSERAQSGWTEGVAIWVAVIIVSLVGKPLHTRFTISICTDCPHV